MIRTLKEEGGLVRNEVARKVLRRIHQASDQSTSEISALEKVKKGGRTAKLSFDLDGTLNHGKLLIGIDQGLAAKTFERALGFFLATLAD